MSDEEKPCLGPQCTNSRRNPGGTLCVTHQKQRREGQALRPLRPKRRQGASRVRDALGNKECGLCRLWLPESRFPPHPRAADGLAVRCMDCLNRVGQARRHNTSTEFLKYILARQGGVCAVCGLESSPDGRCFAVDHDHSCCTGERSCGKCIRGLLCVNCNNGLGRFYDNPELLRAAARYLERPSGTEKPRPE